MYREYNKENNEIKLLRGKYYDVKHDINSEPVNLSLANGLRSFLEKDIHNSEFMQNYLDALKRTLTGIVPDEIRDSLQIYDSDTIKTTTDGLNFYQVRVLITWNGDMRPLKQIKHAWHENRERRVHGQPSFKMTVGSEYSMTGSSDDYMCIFEFPEVSDNCTIKLFPNHRADLKDGNEYYFRLKLDNDKGIYHSLKNKVPSITIITKDRRMLLSKERIVDSFTKYDGKNPSLSFDDYLYILYATMGGRHLDYFYDCIQLPGLEEIIKPNKIEPKTLEDSDYINKAIQDTRFNKQCFTFNHMELDGWERVNNVVGYTLALDNGTLHKGDLITEQNKNQLDPSKPVFVQSYIGFERVLCEDITVNKIDALGYYSTSINEEFIDSLDDNELTRLRSKLVNFVDNGDTITFPAGTQLTKNIQDILLHNGQEHLNVVIPGIGNRTETLFLMRPIFLKDDLFHFMLNVVSELKAVKTYHPQAYYDLLDLDVSYNKKILTPEEMVKNNLPQVWISCLMNQRNKIGKFLAKHSNDLTILLSNKVNDARELYPLSRAHGGTLRALISKIQSEMHNLEVLSAKSMTNPIQYISTLTQIDFNLNDSNAIAFNNRMLSVAMFGRLDSYEVPMSQKLGVSVHLTVGCRISREGHLNVRYRKVVNRQITNEFVTLRAIEEHNHIISSLSELDVDDNGYIKNTGKVYAKVQSTKSHFACDIDFVDPSEIDLVSVTILDEYSWTTAMLPFVGNNDAARVTFATNQIKQAKTILNGDAPGVITPIWRLIPHVQIPFTLGQPLRHDKFSTPKVFNTQHSITIQYRDNSYTYDDEFYTNSKCTIMDDVPILGVNALVAFYPDGSTYEDCIHVSKRFANRLTSYRIDKVEMPPIRLSDKKDIYIEDFQQNQLYPDQRKCTVLSKGDVVCSFPKIRKTEIYKQEDSGLYLSKSVGFATGSNKSVQVKYNTLKITPLGRGDKLSNRHANKGVLSFSSPSELPKLPNGKEIEVVYNPLGVISRMNLGQIYEAQLGLIARILKVTFNCMTIDQDEISYLMKLTHKLVNSGDDYFNVLKEWNLGADFEEEMKYKKAYVQSWAGVFDEKGLTQLSGTRTKVLFGVLYVSKLSQESETKINARGGMLSESRYSQMTGAPLKGAKVVGAQKFGNMEQDAYASYGAYKLMDNLYNDRCNNSNRAFRAVSNIINTSQEEMDSKLKYIPDIRISSSVFISLMRAIGIDVKSDTNNNINYVLGITKETIKPKYNLKYGANTAIKEDSEKTIAELENLYKNNLDHRIIKMIDRLSIEGIIYDEVKNQIAPNDRAWSEIFSKYNWLLVNNFFDFKIDPYKLFKEGTKKELDDLLEYYRTSKIVKDNENSAAETVIEHNEQWVFTPLIDINNLEDEPDSKQDNTRVELEIDKEAKNQFETIGGLSPDDFVFQ